VASWTKFESTARLFLVFVLGGALSYANAFPFKPYLHDAFMGTAAVTRQLMTAFNVCGGDVWLSSAEIGSNPRKVGVIVSEPGKYTDGFVLTTIGQSAQLIDRQGKVAHEWKLAYQDLPSANGPLSSFIPDNLLYWQRAVALPDGDLIVIINANCLSPDGLALARLDKNSNVKWVRHGHYHHDFDVGPDGTVYALWQDAVSDLPARYAGLERPLLDEGIEIISAKGETLKRVSIIEGFARSDYATILEASLPALGGKPGDRMHNNNVDVLTAAQATAIPGAKAGDVLLSLRETGALAVLSLAENRIAWATRGSWFMQHDPDLLPNGNILLFDNRGNWSRQGQSRVMEFDPHTEAVVWQFPPSGDGKMKRGLFTGIRGEQAVLPNGSILINETQAGRVLEVTRDHEVVWEYACPVVLEGDAGYHCNVMSTRHYTAPELPFLSETKTSSALLEDQQFKTLD
jgi:hypothetical protein